MDGKKRTIYRKHEETMDFPMKHGEDITNSSSFYIPQSLVAARAVWRVRFLLTAAYLECNIQ